MGGGVVAEHHGHLLRLGDDVGYDGESKPRYDYGRLDESEHHGQEAAPRVCPFHVPLHNRLEHVGKQAGHEERKEDTLQEIEQIDSGKHGAYREEDTHGAVEGERAPAAGSCGGCVCRGFIYECLWHNINCFDGGDCTPGQSAVRRITEYKINK